MQKVNKLITYKEFRLVLILIISLAVAISIVIGGRQYHPVYRPFVQDLRLVDSVQIADALDQEHLNYYADVKNHMLYVDQSQSKQARLALAKIGLIIEYPTITKHSDLSKAYEAFLEQQEEKQTFAPIWEQPWFMQFTQLILSGLVLIVWILAVVRPALRELIYGNDELE